MTFHGDKGGSSAWAIEPGDITTRKDISEQYGGSTFGGIEPSRRTPNVVIYTDPVAGERNGYNFDGWDPVDPGVYYYTGEGRRGDQVVAKGNKALLTHADDGREVRLFEVVDEKKRAGGNRQQYVGAFAVDPDAPYRWEQAPDSTGEQRRVLVFRLLARSEVSTQGNSAGRARVVAQSVVLVPPERNLSREFEFEPRVGGVARREEAALVESFEAHLLGLGHEVMRIRIPVPGEARSLVTDTYDVTDRVLFEAKSSVDRGTIRLAVGQLLDYLRWVPDASGAVLLPAPPSADLVAFVTSCGLSLTWKSESGSWTSRLP